MEQVSDWLDANSWAQSGALVLLVVFAAVTSYLVILWIVLPFARAVIRRSTGHWDNLLLDKRLLRRVAFFGPALLLWVGVRLIPGIDEEWLPTLRSITNALLLIVGLLVVGALLSAINNLYEQSERFRGRSIEAYLQIARLLIYLLGGILAIAIIANRSPIFFIGGLGAITAVLLLIFRTTILSLVASIQITTSGDIQVGDWIEMPQFDADGDVIDVTLQTIRIQNWDKTIVSIPTYKLLEESFRNWRGMTEAGGRRIKRAIFIDVSTIRFLTDEEIERFRSFEPLSDYMERKLDEIRVWNEERRRNGQESDPRRLTNIGTFRAYVWHYLENREDLETTGLAFLVRQRQPGPSGLPMEIYVFTSDTTWTTYEGIQSGIFDHLLAMIPEFGLRVFQDPTGRDMRGLAGQLSNGLPKPEPAVPISRT